MNSQFLETYLKDTIQIREYKTTEQHDLDLTAGRIDAIFAGHGALKATQEKPEFKDMVIAGTGMRGGVLGRGVAVAMRKDDAELKKSFDAAIQAAIKDGTDQEAVREVVQDRRHAASLTKSDIACWKQSPGPATRIRDMIRPECRM